MLSPVPSQNSFHSIYRSSTSHKLCPQLPKDIKDIAIRRIAADLLKSLLAIKRNDLIDARNRVDIPHGLFGLSFEDFYTRRRENSVYLDVLQLVCRETLEKAKFCIVLDDLFDFLRKLFNSSNVRSILSDIKDSEKLLTIDRTIRVDFKKNSEDLQKLRDKLNTFNVHERNTTLYTNSLVYGVQHSCIEAELVLDPIESRYKLNYHYRTEEQCEYRFQEEEEKLRGALGKIERTRNRENSVSESVRIRQRMELDMLKMKLDEMTDQYDREYELLDGQISYKTNAMEAMRSLRKDCLAKMQFFSAEMVLLREWERTWERAWELKKSEQKQTHEFRKRKPKETASRDGRKSNVS